MIQDPSRDGSSPRDRAVPAPTARMKALMAMSSTRSWNPLHCSERPLDLLKAGEEHFHRFDSLSTDN